MLETPDLPWRARWPGRSPWVAGVGLLCLVSPLLAGEIHEAARIGDLRKVSDLIDRDTATLRSVNPDGETALHEAANMNQIEVVKLLLAKGADVNMRGTNTGATPLLVASMMGNTEVAELLIATGADVNLPSFKGTTPLHVASYQGHRDIVQLLLAKKANVNARTQSGLTPLQWAFSRGHNDVGDVLLKAGAEYDAPKAKEKERVASQPPLARPMTLAPTPVPKPLPTAAPVLAPPPAVPDDGKEQTSTLTSWLFRKTPSPKPTPMSTPAPALRAAAPADAAVAPGAPATAAKEERDQELNNARITSTQLGRQVDTIKKENADLEKKRAEERDALIRKIAEDRAEAEQKAQAEIEAIRQSTSKQVAELSAEMEEATQWISEMEKQTTQARAALEAERQGRQIDSVHSKARVAALEKESADMMKLIQELRSNAGVLVTDLRRNLDGAVKIHAEAEQQLESELEDLQTEAAITEHDLRQRLTQAESRLAECSGQLTAVQGQLAQTLGARNLELPTLRNRIAQLAMEMKDAELASTVYKRDMESLRQSHTDLQRTLQSDLETTRRVKDDKIAELKSKLTQRERRLAELEAQARQVGLGVLEDPLLIQRATTARLITVTRSVRFAERAGGRLEQNMNAARDAYARLQPKLLGSKSDSAIRAQ